MDDAINYIQEDLLRKIYDNGVINPFKANLFELYSTFRKMDIKNAVNNLISRGIIYTYLQYFRYRKDDFFYEDFMAFFIDTGLIRYEGDDIHNEDKFSIEILRFIKVIHLLDEGHVKLSEVIDKVVELGSNRSKEDLEKLYLITIKNTCKVEKHTFMSSYHASMMTIRVDFDTISYLGKALLDRSKKLDAKQDKIKKSTPEQQNFPNFCTSKHQTYDRGKKRGRGGGGTVFECKDKEGNPYAIKIFTRIHDKTSLKRFKNEINLLTKFEHTNIINIEDSGTTRFKDQEVPFYIMPLMKGDLREVIEEKHRISLDEFGHIIFSIIDGLEYIHNHDTWHRDLKPENILISYDNVVKLADFGIAHIEEDYQITNVKTPDHHKFKNRDYYAPEQGTPDESNKVDQFALGFIIFEMLMDELPRGQGKKISDKIKIFDSLLDDIIDKLIARSCDDRYESCEHLKELFEFYFEVWLPTRTEIIEEKYFIPYLTNIYPLLQPSVDITSIPSNILILEYIDAYAEFMKFFKSLILFLKNSKVPSNVFIHDQEINLGGDIKLIDGLVLSLPNSFSIVYEGASRLKIFIKYGRNLNSRIHKFLKYVAQLAEDKTGVWIFFPNLVFPEEYPKTDFIYITDANCLSNLLDLLTNAR